MAAPRALQGNRFVPPELARALGSGAGREGAAPLTLTGLSPGALPYLATLLPRALERPIAFVVASREEGELLVQDAPFWAHVFGSSDSRPLLLPALEPEPWLGVPPHLQVVIERASVLHAALSGQATALVIPVEALVLRVPGPEVFRAMVRTLSIGDRLDRDELVRELTGFGYRRQDMVGSAGEIAVRGGILDVWSPAAADPYRIELFGDEVLSVRLFDPVTQRSADELESAVLLPLLPFPVAGDADQRLREWGTQLPEHALASLRERREELRTRGTFAGIEYWAPVLAPPLVSLLDCIGDAALAVIEPEAVAIALEKSLASMEEAYREASARGSAVPPPSAMALSLTELRATLEQAPLRLQSLGGSMGTEVSLHTQPARRYEGRIKDLVKDLARDREQGTDAILVLPTPGEAERVEAMLTEYEVPYLEGRHTDAVFRQDAPLPAVGRVAVATGRLSQGFRAPELHLSVYAAPDVFGGALPPTRRRRSRAAAFASDFRDLKIGDHVVHVDHGIAKFQGLKHVEVGGAAQEFMVLSYSDDDRLYVPLDRLDLIQKFSGVEGSRPRVDTLGSKSWATVKTRVKQEIREMASELLRLYASRRVIRGHAFAPDGLFQKEFEDAFPFTETIDQAQAIADVKKDMESDRCMDRLLCGDVGYGKTEVAMRAAFKAVADGKQVAVLTPTTVLTFQHFRSFGERFKAFPVSIGTVSRFRSKAQIDDTLKQLAEGKVDVLIGTHRLLSKDVTFRDLGLLIVDEEQRFGVTHKEKLKQLSQGIDVLSMSATPIPRTLQMSLAGLRDMSVIETPPKDRLAIETALLRWEGKGVKEGIKREMERGGQVYFIHNRVESIYAMADTLRKIAPFARVTVAHGQMKEHELESAMMTFVERKADILLATTIIENGIDLPNVNTIFINRAHRLGLAQLYQLRGRVGRSDRPAYAYLLVPRDVTLSPVARRRLHAIQEFTDLGSGFRIAALDLELRGAGSVLGREQHGHITAVGFDLYMELLEQAVREMKGEAVVTTTTTVSLGLDVHVPENWIDDQNQRLMVYKRVANLRTLDEVADLQKEIADRFGTPPTPVENLLDAARLKIEAAELGILAVEREAKFVRFRVGPNPRIAPDRLVAFASAQPGRKVHTDGRIEFPSAPGRQALDAARLALSELR